MKLLVDVGNSRVKWAFSSVGRFLAQGEALRDDGTALGALLECGHGPDEIRISNVAGPEVGAGIAASLQKHFRIAPVFANSAATGAGVRNGYILPGQLGVDRWLAVCAAFARYGAAVCVVDAGTATTIDLVTGSGHHQGGLILPGLELMQSALLRGTGDLARLSEAAGRSFAGEFPAGISPHSADHPIVLGRDTVEAIRSGALQATVSLVRACLDAFSARSPLGTMPPTLVVTGGAGSTLQTELLRMGGLTGAGRPPGLTIEYRPQLVLEGLALDPPCFLVVG